MPPEVSLIIPMYNAEKYLQKALTSVTKQTFKNFEAIIVNDGSTDNSVKIAQRFSEEYKYFKILHKKNGGPGSAKNFGIKYSKGKYIAFLDSDDFLDENFLEVLYKMIISTKADIACCNFKLYYTESNISVYMPFTAKTGVYTKEQAFTKLISDISMHHFPWNKLYKKSIFTENNIEFSNMFYEDVATCPKIFYCANKVAVTSKPYYFYRRHQNSIIAIMDSVKINDFVKTIGIIRNFLETKNEYKKYKKRFQRYAKRIKLQVYYCIVADYIRNKTVHMIFKNLKNASNSIDYFISDNFTVSEGPIELPYEVNIPKNDRKIHSS